MLGQAVRRFATSAVRSSHYAEGPGKVRPLPDSSSFTIMVVFCDEALCVRTALTLASGTWRSCLSVDKSVIVYRAKIAGLWLFYILHLRFLQFLVTYYVNLWQQRQN